MPCRHPLLKRKVASEGRDLTLQSEETSVNDKRDGPSFHSIAARKVSCLAGGPFQEHMRQSSIAWHLSAACCRLTRCFEKPT